MSPYAVGVPPTGFPDGSVTKNLPVTIRSCGSWTTPEMVGVVVACPVVCRYAGAGGGTVSALATLPPEQMNVAEASMNAATSGPTVRRPRSLLIRLSPRRPDAQTPRSTDEDQHKR